MAARAGIYARIASDKHHDALGVQRQRENRDALARRKSWEVVAVHVDNDTSAAQPTVDSAPLETVDPYDQRTTP